MSSLAAVKAFVLEKRHRLAPLVVAAAILVLGSRISKAVPREVELRYDLGDAHRTVEEATIEYRHRREPVQMVRFAYAPEEAPRAFEHRLTLSPGRYEIVAEVRSRAEARRILRSIEVPAEGTVRIELFEP
ncbi:MAG: hypothetical protein H5U40_18895 [Polyangiaceae bacterium]|nr:hypothetical protein [Polyangiaceae bacterium]